MWSLLRRALSNQGSENRRANGQPIKDLQGSWNRACREAGLWGKIPHDFRQTAVRNMVSKAGIPEQVAMLIAGHKTRAVFDYHIVSDRDLQEAAQRLSRAFAPANGHKFGHTVLPQSEGVLLNSRFSFARKWRNW